MKIMSQTCLPSDPHMIAKYNLRGEKCRYMWLRDSPFVKYEYANLNWKAFTIECYCISLSKTMNKLEIMILLLAFVYQCECAIHRGTHHSKSFEFYQNHDNQAHSMSQNSTVSHSQCQTFLRIEVKMYTVHWIHVKHVGNSDTIFDRLTVRTTNYY